MKKNIKQGFNAAAAVISLSILSACTEPLMSDVPYAVPDGLRTLNSNEIHLARSVFADEIDYSSVYIKTKNFPSGSKAFNSVMRFSKGDYSTDFSKASLGKRGTFIHELEHLRQEQNGTNLILAATGLFFRGAYFNDSAYDYGNITSIKSFSDLNIEQKAALTEDFYETREKHKDLYSVQMRRESCYFQRDAAKLLRPHLPHIEASPHCNYAMA